MACEPKKEVNGNKAPIPKAQNSSDNKTKAVKILK